MPFKHLQEAMVNWLRYLMFQACFITFKMFRGPVLLSGSSRRFEDVKMLSGVVYRTRTVLRITLGLQIIHSLCFAWTIILSSLASGHTTCLEKIGGRRSPRHGCNYQEWRLLRICYNFWHRKTLDCRQRQHWLPTFATPLRACNIAMCTLGLSVFFLEVRKHGKILHPIFRVIDKVWSGHTTKYFL